MATRLEDLSDRQRDVLARMARGLSNEQIAAELGISYETVRHHIRQIYDRLPIEHAAQPRVAAVVWWQQQGKGKRP